MTVFTLCTPLLIQSLVLFLAVIYLDTYSAQLNSKCDNAGYRDLWIWCRGIPKLSCRSINTKSGGCLPAIFLYRLCILEWRERARLYLEFGLTSINVRTLRCSPPLCYTHVSVSRLYKCCRSRLSYCSFAFMPQAC